ncbi:MAG: CBS domain-containing protein, partial [Spirochaetales bacterium]|nr:CBS domain-containing protein [Spirochaetales bacterium]
MLVKEQMTANPITVTLGTTVPDALTLMRERKVRRFPVVDKAGKLVGIVSEKDLLYASASPATTLNVWEINALLAKLQVDRYMSKNVVTVAETTPLEEAARIMADKKIGGLPVVRDGALVGIITETDVFRSLLELLGGRRKGLRLTTTVDGTKGSFAKVVDAIAKAGGDIVGLGCSEVNEGGLIHWQLTIKIQELKKAELEKAI